jgi:Ca-activated chloride channel family protein
MSWLWPELLYLLVLIPLVLAGYILILRRRRRFAVRYSSLALVRDVVPARSNIRRHLPFALLLLGLTGLLTALGRPVAIVDLPTSQVTVILAIDVSRSMCSTDILPSRIQAAEAAALSFVKTQVPHARIGIVAFSGIAELVQAPTTDQNALEAAIQSLLTGRRTAIGNGILQSIDAIAEVDPGLAHTVSPASPGVAPAPVPKGDYAPDIIVLLTDGASNTGPQPLDAAQQAADRGLRVYTIGFGTANGSDFPNCSQQVQGFEPPGGGFGGGGGFGPGGGQGFSRGIDELTLKKIAALTGGSYFSAQSASELNKVFTDLPTSLIVKHGVTEITVFFAAFGTLLAGLAILLALLWHPLP